MIQQRSSGILAHITSLPSLYGVGDLGSSCSDFLTFLQHSKQHYWQILPTVPTKGIYGHSPYMSNSGFAGNPLLISPQLLVYDDFLQQDEINNFPHFSPYLTDYDAVAQWKTALIDTAAKRFFSDSTLQQRFDEQYQQFLQKSWWVEDYALFMTAKEIYPDRTWNKWPQEIALRNPTGLQEFAKKNVDKINRFIFEQFIFDRQWYTMKQIAKEKDISIIGDLPIYVSFDSVDVWTNHSLFVLDRITHEPTHVAGVPPDYFCKTGQRWGNPLYDWQSSDPAIRNRLYDWWEQRLQHTFAMVDTVRIDHFRGFESYWAIPAENETAVEGEWLAGPDIEFFVEMEKRLGILNVIAEDLGIITDKVRQLLRETNFPGMKVLLFAFDGSADNPFLPHNFENSNCVVYTGTHDNSTVVGWYFDEKRTATERSRVRSYTNYGENQQIHKDMIYLAHSSTASLSIIALQDLLGFGNDCRMNTPGKKAGNWRWRCPAENFTEETISFLREITVRFNRGKSRIKNTNQP